MQSNGISTDTRKIEKGSIFFALKGENFNGNEYALQALEKGAEYAVVEKIYTPHDHLVQVSNVLETLQELANFHRRYLKIPIIAVTGSNGKTTTKELVQAVLSKKFEVIATVGNLNNHIGVPLTLLSMNKETEIGIVEMGANHLNEIAFLCRIAEPDYGYITNFGKAHLEGFGGIEGVIKGKSELYDFLKNRDKTIFINDDDVLQVEKTLDAKTYTFGKSHTVDCRVDFIKAAPFVEVEFAGLPIKSQLLGNYNAMNITAAIGVGNYFKVPPKAIQGAIENYRPNNNRSQIIEKGNNKIILDAYNANPTSMAAALESFDALAAENKILILGDMFEVGKNSLQEHQTIVDIVERYNFDRCFFCGENFYQTKKKSDKMSWDANFEELKETLQIEHVSNSNILIKGSRGMALERVLEYL